MSNSNGAGHKTQSLYRVQYNTEYYYSLITHADYSRGSKAFIRVCLCLCVIVCVCVCPHVRTKTAEITIIKIATGIVHHHQFSLSINARSKGQGHGHKMQNKTYFRRSSDRVIGVSLHSIE